MRMMRMTIVVCVMFLWTAVATAVPAEVPNVMLFQSALSDDGGNPIADGPAHVLFRITDEAGAVLYEEHQELDVVRGQVSALVGNGLTVDGAPTGGVSPEILDPVSARYLTVELDGEEPFAPLEIASVPYALFANEALGAAEGAIDGEAIADGSIRFEDLSAELIARLGQVLADGGAGAGEVLVRGDLSTMYRDPQAAISIGVAPRFSFSGANELQGVLQDLDRAIGRREERIGAVGAALAQEVHDRTTAIAAEASARSEAITAEASARIQTDTAEANARESVDDGEAAARAAADAAIVQRIDGLDPAVSPPPVPHLHANAWCRIDSCGMRIFSCSNATVATEGLTQCRITFLQPLASDQYAVAANPDVAISERAGGGFLATCGGGDCRFDFIAIGH